MSYKTILVALGGGELARPPLEVGYACARKFGAHIEVLHARPDPRNMIPYVGEGMSGALIEEVMSAAEREAGERAVAAQELFRRFVDEHDVPIREAAGQDGVSARWVDAAGREDEAVATYGRLSDLIVVNRPSREAEVPTSTVFEAALFESGQALLVAPPEAPAAFGRKIMLAWNGSPEAARAVTSALPFLTQAEEVIGMSAAGWGEGPLSLDHVARRLSWHGVDMKTRLMKDVEGRIGEVVLEHAAELGADMIVMGAYTQSRLRQMILGGVTRHVLSHSTLPLLMAH